MTDFTKEEPKCSLGENCFRLLPDAEECTCGFRGPKARSQPQSPPVEQKEWPRVWRITSHKGPSNEIYTTNPSVYRDDLLKEEFISLAEATAREAALRDLLKKAEEALEELSCPMGVPLQAISVPPPESWRLIAKARNEELKERIDFAQEALAAIRAGREGQATERGGT